MAALDAAQELARVALTAVSSPSRSLADPRMIHPTPPPPDVEPRPNLRLVKQTPNGVGDVAVGHADRVLAGRGALARRFLFFALGMVLVVLWILSARYRAAAPVAEIREVDRRALYERTLENLRFCNANGKVSLQDFCRQQAELILTLPECDDACIELSRRRVAHPTR